MATEGIFDFVLGKQMLIPTFLKSSFSLYWQHFTEACDAVLLAKVQSQLEKNNYQQQLMQCWMGSEFAAELCIKHPLWLLDLLSGDDTSKEKSFVDYESALQQELSATNNEEELCHQLRLFRNRQMLRIIWRDFNRLANTRQTTAELTYLADVCVQQSLNFLHQQCCKDFGVPRNAQGDAQQMLVLAMGKHGAHELNLSSDIDLIFTYPEDGETDHTNKPISNHEFFIKLGQKIIRVLDQHTVDGFVFRVDMALRPYGESGALACSFDALENYYQQQGRSWERYAMIKARVISGDSRQTEILVKILRSFTYRRYIDFSAIESLRDMKHLINREVKRKGYENNIKLGAGGIREIEFIVQSFQLIRGGRDTDLQQRELLVILPLLVKKQLLPESAAEELTAAYLFLRDTEHALQGYQDKQTQQLPMQNYNSAEQEQARLAFIMGFGHWQDFYAALQKHRALVAGHFKNIADFDEEDKEEKNKKTAAEKQDWAISIWESKHEDEMFLQAPDTLKQAVPALFQLQKSKVVSALQTESRQRLDDFIPCLLQEALNTETPSETLLRLLPFVYAVLRRTAYLVLLNENLQALKQLVLLSAASPWIAEELATHPVLLDELLDERTLYTIPDRKIFADVLRQETLRIPLDDLEAHMEALRYFKQAHRLRVAACEVTGRLPLMKVSDYLTFLAEVILSHALTVAWHATTVKYGFPLKEDGGVCDPSFIVVGYGKLGGLELGHNSDLDVVFIHGADPFGSTQHSSNSIDNATFYARLGQRIIHILETRSHSGQLYEMDTQLRPSGNSGLLVTSMNAFRKYQLEQAWTWEHQALVRARVVVGCSVLAESFEQIRCDVLSRQRDISLLKKDVVEMREKMVKHHASKSERIFDIKQDKGGIIDIEFMVQYAVLAWSHQYPQLLRWPDNIRILEELMAVGLLDTSDAQQLIESYKALRCAAHRLALQQQGSAISADLFQEERRFVMSMWKKFFDQ